MRCMISCFLRILLILSMGFVFAETTNYELVYLASFPRSGNHWVRFLVEEATRIATSSIYRDADYPHLPHIFPWGGYSTDHGYRGNCRYPTESEAVLLKTHYPCLEKRPLKQTTRKKVCLIRHPIDALYSFHVYLQKRDEHRRIPSKTLHKLVEQWRKFYGFWEMQENVLLIRYEDLYEHTSFWLAKIIDTLGYAVQFEDIQRAVNLYPPRGGILKHRVYYKEEDIQFIRGELKHLLLRYNYAL